MTRALLTIRQGCVVTAVHDAALASRWISQLMGGLAGKTLAEKHNSNVQADDGPQDEPNDVGSRDSPRRRRVQKGKQNLAPRSIPPPIGSPTASAGAVMAALSDTRGDPRVPKGSKNPAPRSTTSAGDGSGPYGTTSDGSMGNGTTCDSSMGKGTTCDRSMGNSSTCDRPMGQ